MKRIGKLASVILAGVLLHSVAQANSALAMPENTIRIDSRIFSKKTLTHNTILNFGQNAYSLGSNAFDLAFFQTNSAAYGFSASFFTEWAWLWTSHEFGHRQRLQALGIDRTFKYGFSENITTFYAQALFRPVNPLKNDILDGQSTVFNTNSSSDFITYNDTGYTLSNSMDRIYRAAGFSIDSAWAGRIADNLDAKKSIHISSLISYTRARLFPALYFSTAEAGDVKDLANNPLNQKYSITENDFRVASLISFFGSATTYALWSHAFTSTNSFMVEAPKYYYEFRPVDIEAYFSHGISYKVKSAYGISGQLHIPFALEFVAKGETEVEFSGGFDYKAAPNLNTRMIVTIANGGGISLETKILYGLQDAGIEGLNVVAQYNIYDTDTMVGARNTNYYGAVKNKILSTGLQYSF